MIFLRVWTSRLLLLTAAFAALALAAVFWIPLGRYQAQLRAVMQPFLPAPPPQRVTPATSSQFAAAPVERLRIRGCFTSEFDPGWSSAEGRTPLIVALLTQDATRIKNSLSPETVNVAEASGRTPLMIAARTGQVETVRALLSAGADPNRVDAAGRTALQYAVEARQQPLVDLLLPLTSEPLLRTILAAAYERAEWPLIELFLNRTPPAAEWSPATFVLLQRALATGDDDHARLLLSRHTAVPAPPGRKTPLIAEIVAAGDLRSLQTLLRCGADPNTTLNGPVDKQFLAAITSRHLRNYLEGDSGITLLMIAAGCGHEEIVQTLLRAGANRNKMTTKYKMMALYFAAYGKSYRTMQMLLGGGPSPEELRIEINLAQQHAAVYRGGVVVFTTTCSTGRAGFATPPGAYVITDKDLYHRSTIYKVPMPYFMRLSCRDFGMHEGNVSSPHASHGCIRLPGDVARKLFSEIPVGTVVQVN